MLSLSATSNYNKRAKCTLPILFLLLAVILTSGCKSVPTSTQRYRGNIIVEVWSSAQCATVQQVVTLKATVRNQGDVPFEVEVPGQSVLDLEIRYPEMPSNQTIRWSDGKDITAGLTHLELGPGESKSIELQFTAPSTSGFGVSAKVYDSVRSLEDPITAFMIIPVGGCPGFIGP